jgi:aspartate-semialdehyde dehydrogenase
VPVVDGHTETVSLSLKHKAPIEEVRSVMAGFRGLPQELGLPSAPEHPILFMEQEDRPQPARDVWLEQGMATLVGRLRSCPVLDYRMVIMGHNTVRGAAGAAVLNAEAMYRLGLFGCDEAGRFDAAEMKRRAGRLDNASIREMVCSE